MISVVFDKVKRERRVDDETGLLSDEQKQVLMSIDDFHVSVEDVSKVVQSLKDVVSKTNGVIFRIVSVYSNDTRAEVYRIEHIETSDLESMYRACKDGRIEYDTDTGNYSIAAEAGKNEDVFEQCFGGKIFSTYATPTEFYINDDCSFMTAHFGFRGNIVFIFDGSEEDVFDGWDEVPEKIRNLTRYPIGFRLSKLPFDMAKYGNILNVSGDSTIEAECPIQTTSDELIIAGEDGRVKLTVRATGKMQPAIGTLTHTGMSFGRWCPGRNPIPRTITIVGFIDVVLESAVPGFTIGRYGTNAMPPVYLREHATLTAPESKGCRQMINNIQSFEGSTKLLGNCEYVYE